MSVAVFVVLSIVASAFAQFVLTSAEHAKLMSLYTAISCPSNWCPRISTAQRCDQLLANTDMLYAVAIKCNQAGLVTQIQLGAPTPGRCPIDILTTMTSLTTLQIMGESGNSLAAPASLAPLATLTKLDTLNLPWHNFSGLTIPPALTALTLLTSLSFTGTQIAGAVPQGFFTALSRLRLLDLSENRLTSMASLANLRLDYLRLSENLLTGTIVAPTANVSGNNEYCFLLGKEGIPDYFFSETNCFTSCAGGCCAKFAGNLCPNPPTTRRPTTPPSTRATTTTTTATTTRATPMTTRTTAATTTTMATTLPTMLTTTTSTREKTTTTIPEKSIATSISSTSTSTTSLVSTPTTITTPIVIASEPSASTESDAPTTPPIVDDDDLLPLDIIIGCSVGGVVALILLVALVACCVARRRRDEDQRGAHTVALATPTPMAMAGADSQRDMYSTRYDDLAPSTSRASDGIYASANAGATEESSYGIGRIEGVYSKGVYSNSGSSAQTPYAAATDWLR